MAKVLALGGLTIDWLETPSGRHGPALGGNAAYAAIGAHLAGAEASVVAVVGDDYPPELLAQLTRAGIDTTHVRCSAGPSFRVLLDERGPSRTISYLPGSGRNDRLDPVPAQLPDDLTGWAAHLCAIPTASQRGLFDAIGAYGLVTTLDTVIIPEQIEPSADELLALAREVSAFLPSRAEVERLWPGDVEAVLATLHEAGLSRVVVKMGAAGSIGVDVDGLCRMPAVETAVVDPTGAGDAYCGAFCALLADGADLRVAMAWGAAAASVVIEDYGAVHALAKDGRRRVAERAARLSRRPASARQTGGPM
ncbi:MAG TPA: carbohydrate kinase family protein [Candidatus Limnocylindrales bacterium]|nr:carbohydrate kinase family protein [Candidatus Limnocylindrales bacterium]